MKNKPIIVIGVNSLQLLLPENGHWDLVML